MDVDVRIVRMTSFVLLQARSNMIQKHHPHIFLGGGALGKATETINVCVCVCERERERERQRERQTERVHRRARVEHKDTGKKGVGEEGGLWRSGWRTP